MFFNPNDYPVTLHAFGKYGIYVDGERAGNEPMRTVEDCDYTVDALSTVVLGRVREMPEEEYYVPATD